MKNLFKNSVYAAAALVLALGAASCSDSDGDYTFADEREEALRDAAVDFVDNNVIPTYKALADGSIALQEDCEAMLEAFDAGTLTTPLVQAACNDWITTRKHWELSEAYLYGAAADYDIDPYIDSVMVRQNSDSVSGHDYIYNYVYSLPVTDGMKTLRVRLESIVEATDRSTWRPAASDTLLFIV